MNAYDAGAAAALEKLGFGLQDVGTAAKGVGSALFSNMAPRAAMNPNLHAILPTHLKAWDAAKGLGHSGLNMVRGGVFGSPVDTFNRLKTVSNGNLGSMAGKLYQEHFLPDPSTKTMGIGGNLGKAVGLASTALAVGKPAYDIYKATQAPRENRGEMIGRAAASTLAAPVSSQFGLLGQMALAKPVAAVGGWIGKRFDPKPPPPALPGTPPQGLRPPVR